MESVGVGAWGIVPWFREHGTCHIHPDDSAAFEAAALTGSAVFRCEGTEGEYLVLRRGADCYRVAPVLFRPVTAPAVDYGEWVRLFQGRGIIEGRVLRICWHFAREEPYFILEFAGKRAKKRYWAVDFLSSGRGPQEAAVSPPGEPV